MQRCIGAGKWSLAFTVVLLGTPLTVVEAQETNGMTAQISGSTVFYQNLAPIGRAPLEEENTGLLAIIQRMSGRGAVATNIPWLEQYVINHPASPWVASLQANLGQYYYNYMHGRYSKSLETFQAAWSATSWASEGAAKQVGDFTVAHWTKLLASLGRKEALRALLNETRGRIYDSGPLQQIADQGVESCITMYSEPGISYRCGSYALVSLGRALYGKNFEVEPLMAVPSPTNGFSMSRLLELAGSNSLDVVAVEWPPEQIPVVPCVVHWKTDHYAAISGERNGSYFVTDPTFGPPRWLTLSVIREEASGQFLVPRALVPPSWRLLTSVEAASIFGRGFPDGAADPSDGCGNGAGGDDPPGTGTNPGGGSGGDQGLNSVTSGSTGSPGEGAGLNSGCACAGGTQPSGGSGPGSGGSTCDPPCIPSGPGAAGGGGADPGGRGGVGGGGPGGGRRYQAEAAGMPVWRVSEPYINVWLYDQPVGYKTGLGYPIDFKLAYKQRDSRLMPTNIFNFGKMWNCSWLSYVSDFGEGLGAAIMEAPLGGKRTYYDVGGEETEFYSGTLASRSPDIVSPLTGFTITKGDGSRQEYGFVLTMDMTDSAFLTAQVDPFGHTNRLEYATTNGCVLLKYVVDAEGRTNELFYGNASFPACVTSVKDAFGRVASFSYDHLARLTNLVDPAGLSTAVAYDTSGWVTNLVTPYGTNSFEHFTRSGTDTNEFDGDQYIFTRALRVIDPAGSTNLYMLRQNTSAIYTNRTAISNAWLTWDTIPNKFEGPPGFSDTNIVPTVLPSDFSAENSVLYYRNSFHWGPRQAGMVPNDFLNFTTSDYRRARIRHWLHDYYTFPEIGHTLEMEIAPSLDGVNFGQNTWYQCDFGSSVPNCIDRVLPDGTIAYVWLRRDQFYRPTNVVSTYSTGYCAPQLIRTNQYIYDGSSGDLVQIISWNGEITLYEWDAKHELITITNAVGDVTRYSYDEQGRLTNTLTAAGLNIDNVYFTSGDYVNWVDKVVWREIATNSYTYASNLVATHTDPRGNTTSFTYDNLQRLKTATDGRGTITYSYNKLDLAQVVDRMGFTNSFGYDGVRRMIAKTNALGFYTLYDYCSCGALDSIRDNEGHYTYFFYDNAGRLINTVWEDNYSTTNNWNLLGQVTNTIDSAGVSVTNWFNNQGLRYAQGDFTGVRQFINFDLDDRATNIVNADGVSIAMTYDNVGRLRTRKYPDDGVERFGYSSVGMIAYTNQIEMSNYFGFDVAGRRVRETNALAQVIKYTNSPAGDLLSLTDGKDQTTKWNYDQYGRVTNKVDQAGAEILRYAYDPNDRLTNRWSAEKGNTGYGYDSVGNLTFINYPVSPDVGFSYDAMNRRTNMVDYTGTTVWGYTAAGQLRSETGPFASSSLTNSYSNRRRAGLVLEQPTGLWTNGLGYDLANRMTNVTSPAGAFGYLFASTGVRHRAQQIDLPNGSRVTNYFDSSGRLVDTILKTSGGTVRDSYTYVYNTANQRTSVTRDDSSTVAYDYDRIGQLLTADGSVNSEDRGYGYDAGWNLTNRNGSIFQVDGKNQLSSEPGAINDTYDANGNLVVRRTTDPLVGVVPIEGFTYDDENRLVSVVTAYTNILVGCASWETYPLAETDFYYDGLGRLVLKDEGVYTDNGCGLAFGSTATTEYIYDGMRVIQERDANNDPTVSYTRGVDLSSSMEGAGGIGGLLARSEADAGGWTNHAYYFADGNGNVTALLDGSETLVAYYRYDPFGNTTWQSGALADENVYRFSSKEITTGGLYYYGYRFYVPWLQRWGNRDPLGDSAEAVILYETLAHGRRRTAISLPYIEVVETPNLYAFTRNDAIDGMDPFGLHTEADCQAQKDICDAGCRGMPTRTSWERYLKQACWAGCMTDYAACLATSDKGLVCIAVGVGIGAAVVLAPEVTIPILITTGPRLIGPR